MPGPFLAAVIYNTVRHGFVGGPLMIVGHAIIEMAMLIVIIFGLGCIVHNSFVLNIISAAGAGLLIYFGINMLISLKNVTLDIAPRSSRSSNLVFSGITMSIANPYWTVWWLTIGMGLVIATQKQGIFAVLIFFAGHITADLLWYGFVSFMISRGKQAVSITVYRFIIALCAVSLLGFGIYFAVDTFV